VGKRLTAGTCAVPAELWGGQVRCSRQLGQDLLAEEPHLSDEVGEAGHLLSDPRPERKRVGE
jgi:hypothetical protein